MWLKKVTQIKFKKKKRKEKDNYYYKFIVYLYTNYQNSGGSRSVVVNLRNQAGGAEPTGPDVLAKIDFLAGKGWTVLT